MAPPLMFAYPFIKLDPVIVIAEFPDIYTSPPFDAKPLENKELVIVIVDPALTDKK